MLEPIDKKRAGGQELYEIREQGWYPRHDDYEQGEVIIEFDRSELLALAKEIEDLLASA